MKNRKLPLSGVRIIELCQAFSGPLTGLFLADWGAEVIKVERPQFGDEARGYGPYWVKEKSLSFIALNRHKKSVTLDLKQSRGRELFISLVKKCHVITENFTPGTMERFGLGYPMLAKENPSLIYASLSGFGQKGPLCIQPGYEAIMQAFTGIMSFTGEEKGGPLRTGVSLMDFASGLLFAFAIVTSLFEREKTGVGRYLDVSMIDTASSLMIPPLAGYLNLGQKPRRLGNKSAYGAPSEVFQTASKDLMLFMLNDRLWKKCCEVLEKPEWASHPRFAQARDRLENRDELATLIQSILKTRRAEDWVELFRSNGIPCSPINDIADFLGEEQTQTRQITVKVTDPAVGELQLPRLGFMDSTDTHPFQSASAPLLGENNRELLQEELGLSAEDFLNLETEGVI